VHERHLTASGGLMRIREPTQRSPVCSFVNHACLLAWSLALVLALRVTRCTMPSPVRRKIGV